MRHLLFEQFLRENSIFCKTKWYICVFLHLQLSLPNVKLEESTLQQFLKEGKMGILETKRKHKLNLGWGIVYSHRMRIRKTCKETRKFCTTLTRVDKKKDVWKVRRKLLPALLLSVVPGGIQKRVEHSVRRVSGDRSLWEGHHFNCEAVELLCSELCILLQIMYCSWPKLYCSVSVLNALGRLPVQSSFSGWHHIL